MILKFSQYCRSGVLPVNGSTADKTCWMSKIWNGEALLLLVSDKQGFFCGKHKRSHKLTKCIFSMHNPRLGFSQRVKMEDKRRALDLRIFLANFNKTSANIEWLGKKFDNTLFCNLNNLQAETLLPPPPFKK